MNIKTQVTFLINPKTSILELRDEKASTTFVKISITPKQLAKILSRNARVSVDAEINHLELVGRKHYSEKIVFEIPEWLYNGRDEEDLWKAAQSGLSYGWVADRYFGSKDSFFQEDGKFFARVTKRRWI